MYMVAKISGPEAQQVAKDEEPFGPRFPADVVDNLTRLEIWATDFKDAGPDFTEFRAFEKDTLIRRRRIEGF